jgi:two-component system chemotaxis response regulator CheB
MAGALHILVVDDSAVVRESLSVLLSAEPDLEVETAADPLIAMRKMERRRPDVIVLDLEMPRMDGLTFLRKLMIESPLPVVVCSGHTGRGTAAAMRALEQGAVEVFGKPHLGVREFLQDHQVLLVDAVRAAAKARLRKSAPPLQVPIPRPARSSQSLVALGASTGGTEALYQLLSVLPGDAPATVIVQHMPEGFTEAFARRLDAASRMRVREARDGDPILRGQALVAPGNRHLRVERRAGTWIARVEDGPLVCRHRPSVDVLFRSVAKAAGSAAVGVLLTGMGADGAEGLLEMKMAGAATVAQDEATCVVFGMPREAIARGAAGDVLPLAAIPAAILRLR